MRARGALSAAAAAAALALAACGSSHGTGTTADPATAVPASAPLYAGATVRPTGAQQDAAQSAGRALTHQPKPYQRLVGLLQTPGSPALDYGRDVAPWLGPHAGIFLTSLGSTPALGSLLEGALAGTSGPAPRFPFGAGRAQGAIVLDTDDVAKARSFVATQASHAGAHAASYRGVDYQLSPGGVAFGVVGRFAVLGSESGLHGVVDTSAGGPALARAPGYAHLLSVAPREALAHLYANPSATNRAAAESAQGLLRALSGERQTNVSLVPAASSLTLDADTLAPSPVAGSGGVLDADPAAAQALGELPGESWLALGLANTGQSVGRDVRALRGLLSLGGASASGTPSLSLGSVLGGMVGTLSVLGAETPQARRDYAAWMGPAGIFASGSSVLDLKGAVVIESRDPAASRAAVAKLGGQLTREGGTAQAATIPGTDAALQVHVKDVPLVLAIANGKDSAGHTKFVLGLGEASVAAALTPSSTMAGSTAQSAAETALGEGIKPSLIFDVPTLLGLLEGLGLNEDPSIAGLLPFLRNTTTVSAGAHSLGGGVDRARLVVGLRPAS